MLFRSAGAQRDATAGDMAQGLAIQLAGEIRVATKNEELDGAIARAKDYEEKGIPGNWLGMIDRAERRREELREANAGEDRMSAALVDGQKLNYTKPEDQVAVQNYYTEHLVGAYQDGDIDANELVTRTIELGEDAGAFPKSFAESVFSSFRSDNPLNFAASVSQHKRAREANPRAWDFIMKQVADTYAYQDMTLAARLQEMNFPLEQIMDIVRNNVAIDDAARAELKKRYDVETSPKTGTTNLQWLNDKRGSFTREVPGWFKSDIELEGEYPANFTAFFDSTVEALYTARAHKETGDPRPLEWSRKEAFRMALEKFGVPTFGYQKNTLQLMPPESAYPEAHSEDITEQLAEDLALRGKLGIDGPM